MRNASSFNYDATWNAYGYSGRGNVASLINSEAGRGAIIVGSAFTFAADYARARHVLPGAAVFAVNDVTMFLKEADHCVSWHANKLKLWKDVRWANDGMNPNTVYHSEHTKYGADYGWEGLSPSFVLSGYFAMQIAYIMGCRPIILCGCPGSPMKRFFDTSIRTDFGYGNGSSQSDVNTREQVVSEMNRLPEFKKIVRSMSGWTRSYFGGVSYQWQLLEQSQTQKSALTR